MTGPVNGVIGTETSLVIEKLRTKMPVKFKVADGAISANGALFSLDENTGRVTQVKRIRF
jgi:calcineurin-like phosphoesterase